MTIGRVNLSCDNVAVVFYWFSDDCHNVSMGDLVAFGGDFPGVVGVSRA